jgi:hypothetical protein
MKVTRGSVLTLLSRPPPSATATTTTGREHLEQHVRIASSHFPFVEPGSSFQVVRRCSLAIQVTFRWQRSSFGTEFGLITNKFQFKDFQPININL